MNTGGFYYMKKYLAIILTVVLILSALPMSVMANTARELNELAEKLEESMKFFKI